MKIWERIFLYSVIAIMAFHLFLVDSKVESQVEVQDVIRAKQIEIVNDEGQTIIELWTQKEGGFIGIYNNFGNLVVGMGGLAGGQGGAVSVYNKYGTIVAEMFPDKTDGGRVAVYNKTDDLLATMATIEGGGFIGIYDYIGNLLAGMIETSKGYGGIAVFDRGGKISGSLP